MQLGMLQIVMEMELQMVRKLQTITNPLECRYRMAMESDGKEKTDAQLKKTTVH
jgi:hypothetical protein